MIRVLICDDQAIARHGLEMILGSADDIEIVGQAVDGEDAIRLTSRHKPDVILMDLKMPRLNGIEATRHIRQVFPEIRIIALTTYDADEWVFEAVRAGANGYLLKDTPPAQLLDAIRKTFEGKTPVDPSVAGKIFDEFANQSAPEPIQLLEPLTSRELEVLQQMANGLTNAEIGIELHLSEGTIRNNITHILGKLGVKDRTQAVVFGIRHGLIEL